MIAVYYICGDCSRTPMPWRHDLPRDKQTQLLERHPRDRWQTLAGLYLLEWGCRDLGIADFRIADLRFPPGKKPGCASALDFSISHAGDLVGCAIHRSGPVGLDIERIRPIDPEQFLLYLTPAERSRAAGDPDHFFSLWTRKESVVKAQGHSGLRHVPEVELGPDRARLFGKSWCTRPIDLAPGYSACVATDANSASVPIEVRRLQDVSAVTVDE